MNSALFSPIRLRGLELANRIVVSPMCQYMADDGCATDWHLMHLGQFAMGAASLVMAEATAVSPEGRISHKCLGLYSDDCELQLKRVIDFCKAHGVAAMGIQLAHAGRKASTRPPQEGGQSLGESEGAWQTVAPSARAYDQQWHVPSALDATGLAELKAQFVRAAERSVRVGFGLVELHAAHGYLLHQFLSPISNIREDAYGGTLENRMRFPLEVFAAVRAVLPQDMPLGVRVSATDWVEGGWTPDDAVAFSKALMEIGCDFVDVSSGGLDPRQQISIRPGYQVPFAARIKAETGIATMAVGMITQADQAENIVAGGEADMVALARGIMDDPRWAWHAARELGAETAYSERYLRCHPSRWP